jgi:hypothetical protein
MKNKKLLKGVFVSLAVFFGLFLMFAIGALVVGGTSYKNGVGETYDTVDYGYVDSFSVPPMSGDVSEFDYRGGYSEEAFLEMNTPERSLIKTGNISLAVDDIDVTLSEIDRIQQQFYAMKVNLNDYGKGLNRRVNITIKVEEASFEQMYAKLRDLEGEFESSSINVSDVTETVSDLEARLKNYKSVESQYLTILESANTVEETLAVYKELNDIRLAIEMVETQLKNLGTQTEYSYIYLNISQSTVGAEVIEDEWRPAGIFKDASRALLSFGKFLGSILIWLVVFSPVVAVVVVPVVLLKKRAKK